MIITRLTVLALAALIAFGGIGTAIALSDDDPDDQVSGIDMRKDDAGDDVFVDEDDGDAGDGDSTRGDDGTRGGDNTGDRDATRGDDGTRGGDNTYVVPAPAPEYDDGYSDDSADGDT